MFFYVSKIGWFLIQPSSIILILVFTSAILLWTPWARAARRLSLAAAILFVVAGLTPFGHALILPLEERFKRPDLSIRAPDGIIVLGGSEDTLVSDARKVSALNEAGERIVEAAVLARRFPKARVVFSGGSGGIFYRGGTEATSAQTHLVALGLSPDRLILEDKARDTYENALYTLARVKPKPGEHWLLVTSAFHMPRAMGCFRSVGYTVTAWPVDYRTRGKQDMTRLFDKPSEGLRRVDLATREWIGLLVYFVLGRTDALFPEP